MAVKHGLLKERSSNQQSPISSITGASLKQHDHKRISNIFMHSKQAIERWLLKINIDARKSYAIYRLNDALTLSSLTVTYIIVVSGFL